MADNLYHPVTLASDTTDMQASTLSRIGDAFTKGIPAATISGALSVYNTFLDYAGKDQVQTEEAIRKYDANIGDYYADHKEGADLVGFVGTAFIPGTLGMKALQAARAGQALGAVGRALNLTNTRRHEYLVKALQETAESGGTIKSILDTTRRRQLLWETADQALLGTAFELGVVATMNDSPIFDGDSIKDFTWNVALGTVLSGAIGGPLASLGARGILKSAQSQIQELSRSADSVFMPSKLGLAKGTELLLASDNLMKLADDIGNFKFTYNFDKREQVLELNSAGALRAASDRATKIASDKLKIEFNTLAQGDARIGQAYYNFLQEGIAAAKEAGKDSSEIVGLLHGWLANVDSVSRVDLDRMAIDAKKFYINLEAPGKGSAEEFFTSQLFTKKRTATSSKQPYVLAEGVDESSIVIKSMDDLADSDLRSAYRNNPEVDIIQLPDGRYRINPESKRVLRVNDNPYEVRQFVDLPTGSLTSETVPTFGDILTKEGAVYGPEFVRGGGRTFMQPAYRGFAEAVDPLTASSRWAWASALEPKALLKLVGNEVNADDLPVLARLVELEPKLAYDTLQKLKFKVGDELLPYDEVVGLQQLLEVQRYQLLQDEYARLGGNLEAGKATPIPDVRIMAAKLNVNYDWVEEAIDRGFRAPKQGEQAYGKAFPTSAALQPKSVEVTWKFKQDKMLPEDAYKMNMGPMHLVTKELSAHYQLKVRQQVNMNAANAVLEEDAALFWDAPEDAIRSASQEGAGAQLFGASNAGYGETAKLWAQDTGKNVGLVSQKRRDQVIKTLAPMIESLRLNQTAGMELGAVTTALRKSPLSFVFHPDTGKNMLISKELLYTARRMKISIDEAAEFLARGDEGVQHMLKVESPEVMSFLRASSEINHIRQNKLSTLYNAMGLTKNLSDDIPVYAPPINTVKYPYHAFVRTKEKIGVATDVSMITAKSEEQLRELAARVGDDYDVFFKSDTERYYKAKGEYDYGLTLNEARVNSDLARRGVLADFFPEVRLENVMTDWLEWHAKSEEKLVRTAVQVRNRQLFSELQFLSEQYREVSESVTRGIGSRFKSKVADPFGDYIKTALNISKQQEFPLLDSLNEFIDKVGLKAGEALEKGFKSAMDDPKKLAEANRLLKQYGLGEPYKGMEEFILANERYPRNLVRETVQKVNLWLANTVLRLDFANSIINTISTPILLGTEMQSIKGLIKNNSELAGKLKELTSIKVPGQDFSVPSTTRLLADSIGDFFGPNRLELVERYRSIGAIKDVSQLYHEVLDDLSFNPTISPSKWLDRANAAVEKGAKITGNTFTEDFTRFISANSMKRLTDPLVEAKVMTVREQNAYISTFVNRVQGNYVTSQRPIVFQGTTGAAVSLFQTYAFNVLQQLFRHIQAGDKKTLAIFAGLQSTVFGFNGLPFFDAVNTHLIGSMVANNPEHKDAYNMLPNFNKELGDWLLYGTASAFPLFTGGMPALYTRGDINPRHITILPTSIADVPAVAASIKLATAIKTMGTSMGDGVDTSDALLTALQHQGWNRPLAGFAQLLAGQSTTASGALISAANEMQATTMMGAAMERVSNYGGVARLMGARPMDEAVALNQLYRNKTYEALDRARIERLGRTVKAKLAGGEAPSEEEMEDFMLRYARSGGKLENFSQAIQRWSKDANVSIVNQTMSKLNSPYARKLQTIMGGEQLPDYTNQEVFD